MNTKYLLFLSFLFIFSCENKSRTQAPEAIENPKPKHSTPTISFKEFMKKEIQYVAPNMDFVKKRIKEVELEDDEERSEQQLAAVKLLTMAKESYAMKNYNNCISYAAQIPLSNALFSPAQYLIAYSFFHNQSYERAVEIFQGISQNKDFFKEMDREEAAYMHVLAQYNFFEKSKDEFQKNNLENAIKFYLSSFHNNDFTFFNNVKIIKENM